MKKIKKILLAFAPLAAVAIATPVVLTSCSDTSNKLPSDTPFKADDTDSDKFTLPENVKHKKF